MDKSEGKKRGADWLTGPTGKRQRTEVESSVEVREGQLERDVPVALEAAHLVEGCAFWEVRFDSTLPGLQLQNSLLRESQLLSHDRQLFLALKLKY